MDRQVGQLPDRKVLRDDCVHPGGLGPGKQPFGLGELIIKKNRVECQEYARSEPVGIFRESPDALQRVSGCLPRPERRPGDIHGIGTAVNRRDADVSISCRSKKFEELH